MWCGGASNYEEAGKVGDMVAHPGCGRSGPAENRDAALRTVKAYAVMVEEQERAAGRKSETARMIADGDLVLTHRRVTTKADPRGVAHADLYRVRDGKMVEHWEVIQPIPSFSVAGHSMVDGPLEPGRTAGRPPETEK
jgi:hypothetical protein